MPDPREITILTVEDELHACPHCGYALGFHTSFKSAGSGKENPVKSTRNVYCVIIICPECGARFDVGWRVSFFESAGLFVKSPVRPAVCVPHGSPAACLPVPPPHDQHTPE